METSEFLENLVSSSLIGCIATSLFLEVKKVVALGSHKKMYHGTSAVYHGTFSYGLVTGIVNSES